MPSVASRPLALLRWAWACVPSGGSLPENVWRGRRRFLVGLTWFHAGAIALAGPVLGYRWELSLAAFGRSGYVLHTVAEGLIVAVFAALASWPRAGRTFQATAIGFGLMSASAVLVHLSGGYIEAHFHFFVMLAFLALCQDWIPYLLAVAYVAVHHGVVGVLWPDEVYNHQAAFDAPWTWAGIHAGFVLASCVGSVIAWRFNERAFAQTAMILEAAGDGIFGVDLDGRITFANPAAARRLGADARRLVGMPVGRILRHLKVDGTVIPAEDELVLAPLRDGAARDVTDHVFARLDGSYLPVDYVSTPVMERGQLTGLVVSFKDSTERHRTEAELQRSHRQLQATLEELQTTQRQMLLQERLRTVGQMASGIAHDFNNTLSPIVAFSELLLRRGAGAASGETADRYLDLIHTAAQDAAAVVRRLGDLYRERPDDAAQWPVNLPRCVAHTVALTQPRWRSQAQGSGATIEVDTDVPETLPSVVGDEAELRELLTNLIFNAVDAMPTGGAITVRARPEGDSVRLEVADTGTGMPEEVRQRCLEPFYSTKGQHGTGLGLPLVHAITERHRGTLAIESAPGRGTTVVIRLPVHAAPAPAPPEPPPAAPGRPLRVLLVEDELPVRTAVTHQLLADGHTVETAGDGREGLEKVQASWFDVVVTDRAMPVMNGDELAAEVARLGLDRPIVMLTGFGDLMAARRQKPSGVAVLLSKPVTLDALRQALALATAETLSRTA